MNILRSGEKGPAESRFGQIIGNSPALEFVLSEVERVAPTDSTVLILGETGTGKELIARAVHNLSARCGRPFIKLNCAAIPFDLLESELFGHEKGAFTGAFAQKIGRFEMADTGTLFLDEIGDMPLALQPKLLRVLQEQEFERVGSGRTYRINVRVVAATHRDLTDMVARKEFRSDLYYRVNVFPVALPPLRERRQDIPQLTSHFVEICARRM
ncbi:MAG TPA: sigma 54-interacting transcriptional regulator, partial [Candidatus Acidoferrum sp.]|nr:sigma 54-interacting transcriptional regulator [Candidatus Acidoferrum sp.]